MMGFPPQLRLFPGIGANESLLHHFGGKTLLAPWTNKVIDQAAKRHGLTPSGYMECFGGEFASGARRLALPNEFYSEINPHTFNFMSVLQERTEELIEAIYKPPLDSPESRKTAFFWGENAIFYRDSPPECPVEWAQAYYYYCRWAYIGGGSRWSGGISKSKILKLAPNSPDFLRQYAWRMEKITLLNLDFAEAVRQATCCDRSIIYYWDPPYSMDSRNSKDSRHTNGKARRQYKFELPRIRFREIRSLILQTPGLHLVAGYHSKFIDRLFEGWTFEERSSVDSARQKRMEVLWIHNST